MTNTTVQCQDLLKTTAAPMQLLPTSKRGPRERQAWDRMNFGRVLRQVRREADLTQVELGERIGKDRRRVIVLEQGQAVRRPAATEIALLAVALGLPDGGMRLQAALLPDSPMPRDIQADSVELVRSELSGEFSHLLAGLDDVRRAARTLARAADQTFCEHVVPDGVIVRSSRAMALAFCDLADALRLEAASLRNELGRHPGVAGSTPAAHLLAEFGQRQLGRWKRCGGDGRGSTERLAPNQIEAQLDILEAGRFHLHHRVRRLADDLLHICEQLFLFLANLAFSVQPAGIDDPDHTAKDADTIRGLIARRRLGKTLGEFAGLPFAPFAEGRLRGLNPGPQRDHLSAALDLLRACAKRTHYRFGLDRTPAISHQQLASKEA